MHYFDRYLVSRGPKSIERNEAELVSLTCVLLAAKFIERQSPVSASNEPGTRHAALPPHPARCGLQPRTTPHSLPREGSEHGARLGARTFWQAWQAHLCDASRAFAEHVRPLRRRRKRAPTQRFHVSTPSANPTFPPLGAFPAPRRNSPRRIERSDSRSRMHDAVARPPPPPAARDPPDGCTPILGGRSSSRLRPLFPCHPSSQLCPPLRGTSMAHRAPHSTATPPAPCILIATPRHVSSPLRVSYALCAAYSAAEMLILELLSWRLQVITPHHCLKGLLESAVSGANHKPADVKKVGSRFLPADASTATGARNGETLCPALPWMPQDPSARGPCSVLGLGLCPCTPHAARAHRTTRFEMDLSPRCVFCALPARSMPTSTSTSRPSNSSASSTRVRPSLPRRCCAGCGT
jgi:hypothetical protein